MKPKSGDTNGPSPGHKRLRKMKEAAKRCGIQTDHPKNLKIHRINGNPDPGDVIKPSPGNSLERYKTFESWTN